MMVAYRLPANKRPQAHGRAHLTCGFAQWLPGTEHAEPLRQVPQQELRLRLREAEPPFLESTVDLQISPGADGGTLLRIVHVLTDARVQPAREAANDGGFLMYAT